MRCYRNSKRYVVRQAMESAAASNPEAVQEVRAYVMQSWMSGLVDVVNNGPDGVLLISRTGRGIKRELKKVLRQAGLNTPVEVRYA